AGDWKFLTETEFADLLAGRIVDGHACHQELQRKGFLRDRLDLDALAERMTRRNRHIRRGPYVHVVTLTSRGQGSEAAEPDMSAETAEKIADLALQSPSPSITFEFQAAAGEPLLNFAVLRHFVEHARARNAEVAGKTLTFSVISNFSK